MFDRGEIDSYPVYRPSGSGGPHIEWIMADKGEYGSRRHRPDDLPAYEDKSGGSSYWLWGKRHRETGPFVPGPDTKYALNNEYLSKEQFEALTPEERAAMRPQKP